MGRKDKKVPSEKQEACHKLNFLHQASHAVLAMNPDNVEMSRFYASTMKEIAKKLVYKLDPSIKRTVCKCCHVVLVPGVTATVRVRQKRERHIVVKCLCCKTIKRYLCRPGHVLWSERNISASESKQDKVCDQETKQEHKQQEDCTSLKNSAIIL